MDETKTDEQLTNLKTEIETLKNQNAALQKANDEAKAFHEKVMQENRDLKWTLLKNALPMAWKDTPEHEKARRDQYEKEPATFVAELAAFHNQKPAEKQAEGEKMENLPKEPEGDGWGHMNAKKKV